MTTLMRFRLSTAAARTSRKALNVRLRTVIRGLRSSRLVISRIPIGLSVTANATINPAIAKSGIRGGEGSIGRSIDFSDNNVRGRGKLRTQRNVGHCSAIHTAWISSNVGDPRLKASALREWQ